MPRLKRKSKVHPVHRAFWCTDFRLLLISFLSQNLKRMTKCYIDVELHVESEFGVRNTVIPRNYKVFPKRPFRNTLRPGSDSDELDPIWSQIQTHDKILPMRSETFVQKLSRQCKKRCVKLTFFFDLGVVKLTFF